MAVTRALLATAYTGSSPGVSNPSIAEELVQDESVAVVIACSNARVELVA
ncbi:hypothetical protein [Rhodococcus sp. USK13]|nr:hypothetical protein [Rhodococcus sp. USK13]